VQLSQLRRRVDAGDPVPEPEILSVEGLVYVVRIGEETLVDSREGTPVRFPSVYAAACALGRIGLERGWLVHASPYDEMIGRPDEDLPPPQPLRTPVAFPAQD
jgi:hypothetical protein